MSNENGNGNHRNGANNNGHQRNGQVNGSVNGHQNGNANHDIPANGVSKNGNGSNNGNGHHPADTIPGHDLSGTACPPTSPRSWPSPWTPARSPSARAGAPLLQLRPRAARSSTRPTASSASAAGATRWWAT